MFKKSFLKVTTAIACIATLIMPHTSVVFATSLTNEKNNNVNKITLISSEYREGGEESSSSLSSEANDKYDTQRYKYTFGGNQGTNILKILREDDKDSTTGEYLYSDAFYCLDGNNQFPGIYGLNEYTRTVEDLFASKPTTFNISDENYNALCWLLDNMYLRKQMTVEQRAAQKDMLINNAFSSLLNSAFEDRPTVEDIKKTLTDDDIEVVQQWAIWYFTNNGEKSLQNIDFVQTDSNGNLKLPTIDLTKEIVLTQDTMDSTRHEWLTILYQYFVNTALTHKSEEFTATALKYPSIANKTVNCVVDGSNYKIGPFKVTAPSAGVSTSDYNITLSDGTSELLSTVYTIKDAQGNTISKNVKEIFDTEYFVYLPTSANTIQNVKLNLSYTKFGTKASVWTSNDSTYQPLVLLTKEGESVQDSVNVPITVEYDLALRKYIIAVNDEQITDRTPNVDVTNLLNSSKKTAEYKHKKEAVEVSVGDTITYRISIYNEAYIESKATEIIEYLPVGLELVQNHETNIKYGWKVSEDGTVATTTLTKDTIIPGFDSKNGNLTSLYIDIVCRVTDKATFGAVLTNIAEIKSDNIEDRDSSENSMSSTISTIDKATYIGKGEKTDLSDANYHYKGMEDDDDFEKVKVKEIVIEKTKSFDLSLKKFITKVNGKAVAESREPKVDTTPLKQGKTTANYTTIKTPVLVQEGDIVTYKIRVYNEGETDGYAEKIADYLPDGLGYLVNYNENINNFWSINKGTGATLDTVKLSTIQNGTKNLKLEDFTGVTDLNNVDVVVGNMWESDVFRDKNACMSLTTTALSSSKTENLIKAFDGSDKLSYKDVEVTCIVLGNSALTNYAEVIAHLDSDKKEIADRDSIPDNNRPWDYTGQDPEIKKEDDWDYDPLTLKDFDLALQKFITGVNGKEITDRVPSIGYDNFKISYKHPETALEVNNGDSVTYTIRVYNEGEVDGYAAEVRDDIPTGLVFDSSNETNKKYGWTMYDSNGNVTTDASKAVEIKTDYLSKAKAEARKENTLLKAFDTTNKSLHYADVKAVFKVSANSSNTTITNTAEITKDTDSNGDEIDDIDSVPNNKKEGEDDIDKERVHLGYFDLSLQKDLVKAVVTEGDSTKEIPAPNGEMIKVEIHRKKINSTIVKFVYNITIKNEGTIAGYAKEIKDYIPQGLQFVESDNQNWKASSDNVITTSALADKLLQPGETATVQVVLRWVNNENNLGLKTNVAEISKDYNDANDTNDVDSTPDNKKDGEDDIDDAPVILSISTGSTPVYILLTTTVLLILSTGIILIKKYVL